MPGRKPMPIEERKRLGNPQHRPIPGGTNLAAVPALDVRAWDLPPDAALERVLAAGVLWLAETDGVEVSLLREALRAVQEADSLRSRLEAIKLASMLLSELGFTPSARSRLGLAEVKAMSKLEAMQRAKRGSDSAAP